MAPLTDKYSVSKCHNENFESKQQSRLPFRWLLKRSKSTRTAKEMTQSEKTRYATVPASKSCDAAISNFSSIEKCPKLLLWKLLPTKGKTISSQDKKNKELNKRFRTSYSCNDVYGMFSASKVPFSVTHSTYNINIQNEGHTFNSLKTDKKLHGVCKRNSSIDCLNATIRQGEQSSQLSFTHHLVLCKLCLSMIPASNMYSLEDCGCVFCFVCMQQYLLVNIKEGNVAIMCPDADCTVKGKILLTEIHNLVGEEVFYKFQRFKLIRDVELDPTRTWCPTAGCETVCHFQPGSNPDQSISVYCLNCGLTFCSACKLKWHYNKTCEEVRNALSDEEDFALSDDEDAIIKRCPNCRIPIERDEGCAQMMCKRCKHVFCWHCLASLDDDFLLRHYDKGPCRNKLGHSRASMIWHRTQVVGIFAGFSFLLLVASPILLLAAPCFLCCRCRNCKFVYEEATPL